MPSPKKPQVKRVVLAYSGGLDTSIILKWLQTEYGAEVITFTADLGQGEELEPARKKAELLGVKPQNIFIEDLREEFVRDFVFPMFRANAQYEGQYLLGTSIARPLIAKRLVEIAHETGADAVAHGATGKGNDQVRFELSAYALDPDIKIIAPWREWEFASRNALLAFAEQHQIPIAKDKRGEAPFSVDANLLHVSSEGKVLEDPAQETPPYVYSRTIHPEDAPDKPTVIEIAFEKGDPVAIDGKAMSPATLLTALNKLGHDNGIGRLDLVENRYVGMKSRGMYETPGGTILLAAHRAIESITLDRGAAHLKDELMPKYAELIYNGFWFSPERELLQVLIDKSQEMVAGRVRLKLYKGGVYVIGRLSPYSLYDQDLVTFEEGAVAYDHRDAGGFIKLNALRLRTLAKRKKKAAKAGRRNAARALVLPVSGFLRFRRPGPSRPTTHRYPQGGPARYAFGTAAIGLVPGTPDPSGQRSPCPIAPATLTTPMSRTNVDLPDAGVTGFRRRRAGLGATIALHGRNAEYAIALRASSVDGKRSSLPTSSSRRSGRRRHGEAGVDIEEGKPGRPLVLTMARPAASAPLPSSSRTGRNSGSSPQPTRATSPMSAASARMT